MYLLKKLTRLHWLLMMVMMIRPMDSIETYAYGINKDLACKKKRLNKKI